MSPEQCLEGKWYGECKMGDYKAGDIISTRIPETEKEDVLFFKNPMMIKGRVSSGDFFIKISTPFTKADIEIITDMLKQSLGNDLNI